MAKTSPRRQRRPKRPLAYAALLAGCAALALGGAWAATRAPVVTYKVHWRGTPVFTPYSKGRDARATAP
jgi:ABC-type nitrate/sulfonate/bicarbonate transport system substrate-binding protein